MANKPFENAFDKALARLLDVEKGYANHPDDRGGETNYGITKKTAAEYGYHGDMALIPKDLVRKIYLVGYWEALSLQYLWVIDEELAYDIFDSAVNLGQEWPAKWLQIALNTLNLAGKYWDDLIVDGDIGLRTIEALGKVRQRRDIEYVRMLFDAQRVVRYMSITQRTPSQEKFIRSWLNRIHE